MMKKFIKLAKNRHFIFGVLITLLFVALGLRLSYLTIDMGEYYYQRAQERKKIEVTLKGARGNILDRNGVPLAVNRQIYVAQVDRRWLPARGVEINEILKKAIEIIELNGDTILDNIPIKNGVKVYDDMIPYTIDGFYYDFGTDNVETQERRYNTWRSNTGIREDLPADQMLELLRDRYDIEPTISNEMARKMISIRLDLYLNRFRQDEPVKIAEDIDNQTVSYLETYTNELSGIQTVVELGRYYPYGTSAQHIIGYVGKISDNNIDSYMKNYGKTPEEAGYNLFSDKYGQLGIEAYAEEWLTGNTLDKHGYLGAEVDASRRVIQVLDQHLPQDGNDVVLTLDSRLQRITETILEEELYKMREGLPPFDGDNQASLANTAAAVILDINTGEILTMASYANSNYEYNLNDFAQGISTELYGNLYRDPTKPMLPIAFQGGFSPGSTFKMLVGIAALEERKTTPRETIYDRIRLNENAPVCWSSRGHGSVNLMDALKISSNYYFSAIGARMDIWHFHQYAAAYGLNGPTGLELLQMDDRTDHNRVANPDLREKLRRNSAFYNIKYAMNKEYDIDLTDEQAWDLIDIDRNTKELMQYMRKEKLYDPEELDGFKVARRLIDFFDIGRWGPVDYYRVFIGQSDTSVSPLAVSRYIAALVNGSKVMETHVLKEVRSSEGELVQKTEPIYNQLDIKEENVAAVKEGMRRVVYNDSGPGGRGSAVKVFADIDPEITLGGKTGTAQVIPNNTDRNTAWFASFTPYENPEIAVVVTVPNGKTSGNASPIARRIIEEYYKLKNSDQKNTLSESNEMVP
ncbi:MAG: hypothetical protein GX815_03345 [Clostridiales bacterium]|nr:hypothetical protein [Clostridiales bacterium]